MCLCIYIQLHFTVQQNQLYCTCSRVVPIYLLTSCTVGCYVVVMDVQKSMSTSLNNLTLNKSKEYCDNISTPSRSRSILFVPRFSLSVEDYPSRPAYSAVF